jgi:YidC/Oxa1 family membrane protein insertase
MDQVRVILAIALSFVVFLVWSYFFAPQEPVRQAPPAEPVQTTEASKPAPPATEATAPPPAAPETIAKKADVPPPAAREARTVRVETPLYIAVFTEHMAAVKSFQLKKHRESVAADAPYKELVSPDLARGTLLTNFEKNSVSGMADAVYAMTDYQDSVSVDQKEHTLHFTWASADGVQIKKTYVFDPYSYLIEMQVEVENGSGGTLSDRMGIGILEKFPEKRTAYGFQGPSGMINQSMQQVDIDDIEEKGRFLGQIGWVAIQTRYFMSSIVPQDAADGVMRLSLPSANVVENSYFYETQPLAPQQTAVFKAHVFLGPKSVSILRTFNNGLDKAVDFGWFTFLAKPCLWLMNFIYEHIIANYGIAIIILTLLIKGILWPLGSKSYRSMGEMKKIQPLMTEIREKYKDDKKKQNEEIMALYRTYKVNPMGGCLPMIVQIPVFFALYRMLYEAVELRHAPFFLWINDLSAPDRLFSFNVSIPLMEPPYGIPVLTLIMGASMFLQQKMSPPMGDPAQAKMMMLMPVIFTFIFINFSSGLVLYWLVNNLVSIGQQYFIQKRNA